MTTTQQPQQQTAIGRVVRLAVRTFTCATIVGSIFQLGRVASELFNGQNNDAALAMAMAFLIATIVVPCVAVWSPYVYRERPNTGDGTELRDYWAAVPICTAAAGMVVLLVLVFLS